MRVRGTNQTRPKNNSYWDRELTWPSDDHKVVIASDRDGNPGLPRLQTSL
jgi:hypothetical protein